MADRYPAARAPRDCDNTVAGVLAATRHIIEDAETGSARSTQPTIGPSELGQPCDHCLAARLAGWPKNREFAWLPWIGTAVHAKIAEAIETTNILKPEAMLGKTSRFLVEKKVVVGHINGTPIKGSTDLFDTVTGAVIDWKIVGAQKLKSVKASGPGETYRAQAHLYGRGWHLADHQVNHVAIAFLPRNDMAGLAGAIYWTEPYQERIALDALARAETIDRNLRILTAISIEARDAWITGLPRDPDCYDCARHPDAPPTALVAGLGGYEPHQVTAPIS